MKLVLQDDRLRIKLTRLEKLLSCRGSLEVPLHLRNAPTRLMKELDYGKDYRYAHNEPEAYAAGENYFPEGMTGRRYYYPTEHGLEIKIAEKLARFRELDEKRKKNENKK